MSNPQRFKCNCGKTVEYMNPCSGAVNIGHFQRTTGWVHFINNYDQTGIWVCPTCFEDAQTAAMFVAEMLGTDCVSLASVVRKAAPGSDD